MRERNVGRLTLAVVDHSLHKKKTINIKANNTLQSTRERERVVQRCPLSILTNHFSA
jgi:hypothetical protein